MDVLQIIFISLLSFVLGLAFLFVGYRFFLILLPIWGFFVGLWLGALSVSILLDDGFLASVTALVVGVVVGLILAALSYFFYAIGVLLLGASFGYWFGSAVLYALGLNPGFLVTIVAVITALVFATLTVLLDIKKHLIVVITAFGGASSLIISLLLVLGPLTIVDIQSGAAVALDFVFENSILWFVFWLILAVIGIVVQEMTTRGFYMEYDRQYDSDNAS